MLKIETNGLFATYKSREKLQSYLDLHSGNEHRLITLGHILTCNTLAHLSEEEMKILPEMEEIKEVLENAITSARNRGSNDAEKLQKILTFLIT